MVLVKTNDSSGNSFSYTFADADWRELERIGAKLTNHVVLAQANGNARLDGDTLFISLPAPGGFRIYDIPLKNIFKGK